MKKLAALILAAALTVGSAAAIIPEEAFPAKKTPTPATLTWPRAPGTPTPPRCAMRWG